MDSIKRRVYDALSKNDLDAVVALARDERRVLSVLTRLSYEKDTLVGQRAIRAVGLTARELARTDIAVLRETCRKLLWSLSDESGGIGWSAPELLGEIIAADPKELQDLVPILASVYDVEEVVFRPGVLYALSRIGEKAPDLALRHLDVIKRGLSDQDAFARVLALQAIAIIRQFLAPSEMEAIKDAVKKLTNDRSEAWVYSKDDFVNRSVAEEAQKLLDEMGSAK